MKAKPDLILIRESWIIFSKCLTRATHNIAHIRNWTYVIRIHNFFSSFRAIGSPTSKDVQWLGGPVRLPEIRGLGMRFYCSEMCRKVCLLHNFRCRTQIWWICRETMTARTYFRSFAAQTTSSETKDSGCNPIQKLLEDYMDELKAQVRFLRHTYAVFFTRVS